MLDIGMVSYQNPHKLEKAIKHLEAHTVGEYRLLIVDNNSPDPIVRTTIENAAAGNSRIEAMFLDENFGYAGGVNKIFEWAESKFVAYVENDAYIQTPGWNQRLEDLIERNHEVAMAFPNGGFYPIQRDDYTEIQWGVGFCWMLNHARYLDIGGFDTDIGHQEECDYSLRLRLAGWKLAADTGVHVAHDATASTNQDSANRERINNGVINFVNKWCKYFCGPTVNYYSPNVLRWEDWHPNALYVEEYLKQRLPVDFNHDVETITIEGREYDVTKSLRWPHLYRDRII